MHDGIHAGIGNVLPGQDNDRMSRIGELQIYDQDIPVKITG